MTGNAEARTIETRFKDKFVALCVDDAHGIVYLFREGKFLIERYDLINEQWLGPQDYDRKRYSSYLNDEVAALALVPGTATADGADILIGWNTGVIERFEFETGETTQYFDGRITDKYPVTIDGIEFSPGVLKMKLVTMRMDSKGRLYLLYVSADDYIGRVCPKRSFIFRLTVHHGKPTLETMMRCVKMSSFECQNIYLSPNERWLYVSQRGRVFRLSTRIGNGTPAAVLFANLLPEHIRPNPNLSDEEDLKAEDNINFLGVEGLPEQAPPLHTLPFVRFGCVAQEVLWQKETLRAPSYSNFEDPVFASIFALALPHKQALYVAERNRIRKLHMDTGGNIEIRHFIGKGKQRLVDGDKDTAQFKRFRDLHYYPPLEAFVCLDGCHLRLITVPVELDHMQYVRDSLLRVRYVPNRGNEMFLAPPKENVFDGGDDDDEKEEAVARVHGSGDAPLGLPQDVCAEIMFSLYGAHAQEVFEGRFRN